MRLVPLCGVPRIANQPELSKKIAHIALDFQAAQSVHAVPSGEHRMTPTKRPLMGTTFLKPIADRLTRAAGMARAAEACAKAGDDEGAAEIIVDIDIPIYEAESLIRATYILNRIERDPDSGGSAARKPRKKPKRDKR